ncbi:MAG: hypothetical protein ABSH44_06645 [Bryobacteraceae bacterium]|jgi:hypothetical protein
MGTDRSLLEAALVGYQHQRDHIDAKMGEIRRQLGTGPGPASAREPKKRVISAAGRRRIAAAQRKRWAAQKSAKQALAPAKKRKMSAAGRKHIAAATRKRWAAYRAQKAAARRAATEPANKVAARRPAVKKAVAPAPKQTTA